MQALGGGPTGGQLAAGTYFVYYTYTYSNGTETAASPNSAYFTVVSRIYPPGDASPAAGRRDGL